MEKEFCWTLENVLKQNPISPDEKAKWFWFKGGICGTANLVQVRGGERIKTHIHKDHDEFIYNLRGECEFKAANATRKVGPGDFLIIPAGTVHGLQVISDGAVLLSIYAPFYAADPDFDRVLVEEKK
jgi:quercetin dioxygenase-like cupin family protein